MIDALTSGQLSAIRSTVSGMVFLVEMGLDSGTLFLASAMRNVDWGGQTWLGTGKISSVEVIEEKTTLEAVAVRLSLTGVPSEFRSLALQEPIRGRPCSVYVGLVDDSEHPIGDMLLEYQGLLDTPAIITGAPDQNGERSAVISVTVEGILVDHARGGRGRRHTHEDQQELHPGDMFYSLADEISKQSFPWGKPK